MELTVWILIITACAPMILFVIWQLKKALDGGYYYTDEESSNADETTKKAKE